MTSACDNYYKLTWNTSYKRPGYWKSFLVTIDHEDTRFSGPASSKCMEIRAWFSDFECHVMQLERQLTC